VSIAIAMSETSSEVQAPAEDGLIGYSRSPHPQILLKIAIAINDGTPFIDWVAGLYSKEAMDFLIWLHDRIAASELAQCDAQDFFGACWRRAGAAHLSLPPAFYFVAFCFISPPGTSQLSFAEQLESTVWDATVANLEASYYASYYATSQIFDAAEATAAPTVSNRFRRMLKWNLQQHVSVWGKPKCLHQKVGYLSCYECPESGFMPMAMLLEQRIYNKQDLLERIKAKYVNRYQGDADRHFY
jgi:hypothetical protein